MDTSEYKNATCVFIDIVSFTRFSETREPEDVKKVVDSFTNIVTEVINKKGGTIIRFMGDGALAVFGIPRALENHPGDAISACLEVKERVRNDLSDEIKLHIGVATGKILAGKMNMKVPNAKTVIGNAVNVAVAMANASEPDEILVNRKAYQRTKRKYQYAQVSSITIEGVRKPVSAYKFLGKLESNVRERGVQGRKAPFVDRKNEIKIMRDKFSKLIKNKEPCFIFIEGEAGIGKTRLIEEFLSNVPAKYILFARSYPHETQPLAPFTEILKQMQEKYGKDIFTRLFPGGNIGFVPLVAFVHQLIGKKRDESYFSNLSPKDYKQQKSFSILKIIERLARYRGFLVLVFEDLHWSDGETLELLFYLMHQLKNVPIAILSLFRPAGGDNKELMDFIKSAKTFKEGIYIKLNPLSLTDASFMVSKLLAIDKIPDSVKKHLLYARSEGNPFYIEELINVMIERGIIYNDGKFWKISQNVKDMDIPDTIEDLIMVRVDSLNANDKEFMKAASCIGRVFCKEAVESLLTHPVLNSIIRLTNLGFVEKLPTKFLGFREYQFKHTLIQQSVYNSTLKRQRKDYHRKYAKFVLSLASQDEVPAGIIADHFEKGGDIQNAYIYNKKAAEDARLKSFNKEALLRYEKCIDTASTIENLKEDIPYLERRAGEIKMELGDNKGALKYFHEALISANKEEELKILRDIGDLYFRMSQYDKAMEYYGTVERESGDESPVYCNVLLSIAGIYYYKGNFESLRKTIERAAGVIANTEFSDKNERQRTYSRLYNMWGMFYWRTGRTAKGEAYYKKALDISKKLKDVTAVGVLYNNIGVLFMEKGKITKGLELMKKASDIYKKTGNHLAYANISYNIGMNYVTINQPDEAEKYFKEYLEINSRIQNRMGDGFGTTGLAEIEKIRGNLENAEKLYKESIEIFKEIGSNFALNAGYIALSDFYIEADKLSKGKKLIDKAEEFFISNNMKEFLINTLLTRFKYHIKMWEKKKEKEQILEMQKLVNRLTPFFEKGSHDIFAGYFYYLYSFLYFSILRDNERSEFFRKKAREQLELVLSGLTDQQQRESLKKRPDLLIEKISSNYGNV